MSALSAIFWGVVVLSFLVMIHEGGHFLMARALGVRVTEFFLGMPSRFKLSHKSERYGTEFGVTPLLIGGYNRICGMEGQGSEHMADVLACVQRRGQVSPEAVAAELGLDVDVVAADLEVLTGWGSIADVGVVPVAEAGAGAVPEGYEFAETQLYSTLRRDASGRCEYDPEHDFSLPGTSGAGEPREIADPAAFLEEERSHTYDGKGFLPRLLILIAGATVNIAFSFLLVTGLLMATPYEVVVDTNVLGEVVAGGLAEEAGLRAGDALVDVAGTPCETWMDVYDALSVALDTGEPFDVTYERDGAPTTVTIAVPEGGADAIGVVATTEAYHLSIGEAASAALGYGKFVASTVVQLIMPQHTAEVISQSSSVVGISVMASEAAQSGIEDLLMLMAAISMSLGFMNLLPIAPLDGGKILVEVIQAVIRRPLSMKVQAAISYVGMVLILGIFVFALKNDLVNILGL